MTARLRKLLVDLSEAFWLLPALLVAGGVILAIILLGFDRSGFIPGWLVDSRWLHGGGAEGARTLLGTIAASTIGVTGTVFSITIAALSLAAGQMGPRLLRNFTRDRGNQITLGLFLGTFAYSLMVLRSMGTLADRGFVPHLSLSVGILLAFGCVATLVFFVGHIAGRINVDTVIDLVSEDARLAVKHLARDEPETAVPNLDFLETTVPVHDGRCGYLQQIDEAGLADWAAEHGVVIRMLVRPGDFVFPGAPIGLLSGAVGGADAAIKNATALGRQRGSSPGLDFVVRQMVEVAVRALSPGVNDPNTAISVLDRLGSLLCEIAPLNLPSGVVVRDGSPALLMPTLGYEELVDNMFGVIRRHAAGDTDVLVRILDVSASVLGCERNRARIAALQTQALLVIADAERSIGNSADLKHVRQHYLRFETLARGGHLAAVSEPVRQHEASRSVAASS